MHSSVLSCVMVQHETHTNTAAFRIQALIGYLFLSLSFPTTGRTEENVTCISNPFSNLPKALKSLLLILGLIITTSLVHTGKNMYHLGTLLLISLTQAPEKQQASLKGRFGQ